MSESESGAGTARPDVAPSDDIPPKLARLVSSLASVSFDQGIYFAKHENLDAKLLDDLARISKEIRDAVVALAAKEPRC